MSLKVALHFYLGELFNVSYLLADLSKLALYMEKKLYVGGLPYSTTEDSLAAAFSQAGTVESATVIMDKMTGRSRGFGFVEMANVEDVPKAIEMFNGKDFEGRNITVNEARPLSDRSDRSDRPRRSFGDRNRY